MELVYYTDNQPGIRRVKRGRGFSYIAPDGTTIDNKGERSRLASLAVPPAYAEVWMCPLINGHLQATGRDDKKRKQYKYHADWTAAQAKTKFDNLADFGMKLPRIRRRIKRDLAEDAGEKEFALACATALIDRFSLRVGNADYTKENGSYGALTLRNRHLTLDDSRIKLDYIAKGGKKVRKQMADRTLARLLHKIDDLPGAELLSWLDDDGQPHALNSTTLNDYITDAAGGDVITAKTFRTWAGTLAAFEVAKEGHATIKTMSEAAAKRLHNTPTIARNSYIHPDVIDLKDEVVNPIKPQKLTGLRVAEQELLGYLTR